MKRKKVTEEQIELIKKHWDDSDFDKIRLSFMEYLVGTGDYNDDYLNEIADLLGIEQSNSDDGYDRWWELEEPQYIKYMWI